MTQPTREQFETAILVLDHIAKNRDDLSELLDEEAGYPLYSATTFEEARRDCRELIDVLFLPEELGKKAHAAYMESLKITPDWSIIGPGARKAWANAAKAIREAVE